MDYKKNAKYFREKPSAKFIVIALIIALILLVIKAWIGVLALIVLGVIGYYFITGRPMDYDIDKAAEEAMQGLKQRALEKLGIDEDEVNAATPISFWGYDFGKSPLNDKIFEGMKDTRGSDQVLRSPIIRASFFFFSDKEVHYYYRISSLVSDTYIEGTDVFFYKYIVSVKTQTEEMPLYDRKTGNEIPGQKVRFDSFSLRNAGGETTSCTVRDVSTVENSVKAMRNLLREKQG